MKKFFVSLLVVMTSTSVFAEELCVKEKYISEITTAFKEQFPAYFKSHAKFDSEKGDYTAFEASLEKLENWSVNVSKNDGSTIVSTVTFVNAPACKLLERDIDYCNEDELKSEIVFEYVKNKPIEYDYKATPLNCLFEYKLEEVDSEFGLEYGDDGICIKDSNSGKIICSTGADLNSFPSEHLVLKVPVKGVAALVNSKDNVNGSGGGGNHSRNRK